MSGRLLAVCMGVSEYDDAGLEALGFAALDAAAVHTRLGQAAADPSLVVLLPPQATSTQVMCATRRLLEDARVRSGDRIVFYFAGHGRPLGTQPADQLLLLKQADATLLEDDLAVGNDVLSVRTLLALLARWPAEALLLLDTCNRAASANDHASDLRSAEAVLAGLATRQARYGFRRAAAPHARPVNGRQVIVSSAGVNGVAHEAAVLKGGFFARAFCRWLEARVCAHEPGFVGKACVAEWGNTIAAEGRAVGLEIRQQPWLSDPQAAFLVYAPAPRKPGDPVPSRPALLQVREPWHPELALVDLALPAGQPTSRLAVGRDPVTVAQWLDVMGRLPPALESAKPAAEAPVTAVDLPMCRQFVQRLTERARARLGPDLPAFRLLHAPEWTALCQAGTQGRRCGQGQSCGTPTPESAVFRWSDLGIGVPRRDNPGAPLPVHDRRNAVNALGLRGLRGNVREWATQSNGRGGGRLMGGSYLSPPDQLSCGYWLEPGVGGHGLADVGFRVARTATEEEMQLKPARTEP